MDLAGDKKMGGMKSGIWNLALVAVLPRCAPRWLFTTEVTERAEPQPEWHGRLGRGHGRDARATQWKFVQAANIL